MLKEKVILHYDDLDAISNLRVDFPYRGIYKNRIEDIKEENYFSFISKNNLRGEKFDEMLLNMNEYVSIIEKHRAFMPSDLQIKQYESFRDSIISNPTLTNILSKIPVQKGRYITQDLKVLVKNVEENSIEDFFDLMYWGEDEFNDIFGKYELLWKTIKNAIRSRGISEGLINPDNNKWYYN